MSKLSAILTALLLCFAACGLSIGAETAQVTASGTLPAVLSLSVDNAVTTFPPFVVGAPTANVATPTPTLTLSANGVYDITAGLPGGKLKTSGGKSLDNFLTIGTKTLTGDSTAWKTAQPAILSDTCSAQFKQQIAATDTAGTYTGTVTFTISLTP